MDYMSFEQLRENMLGKISDLENSLASLRRGVEALEEPRILANGNGVHRMSLAEVSAALNADSISINVGDTIISPHGLFGELRWTVIGKGIDAQEVGASRQTITLHMANVPDGAYLPFDKPRKKYCWGHNAWEESGIRKWLNGEFLAGFPNADQSAMRLVEKATFRNDDDGGEKYVTCDRLFLLSASELGFTGDNIKDEGATYPFYENPENRKKTDSPSGDESCYWVRSPLPWNAGSVRVVNPDGTLNHSSAGSGVGAAAACVI